MCGERAPPQASLSETPWPPQLSSSVQDNRNYVLSIVATTHHSIDLLICNLIMTFKSSTRPTLMDQSILGNHPFSILLLIIFPHSIPTLRSWKYILSYSFFPRACVCIPGSSLTYKTFQASLPLLFFVLNASFFPHSLFHLTLYALPLPTPLILSLLPILPSNLDPGSVHCSNSHSIYHFPLPLYPPFAST